MSKKYLTIEEAAALIGVEKAELNRLREQGQIRAFADRGNWKFKEEDVENFARNRQLDSAFDLGLDSSESMEGPVVSDSSSDLIFSDDALQAPKLGGGDSADDSDVRLIFDDAPKPAAKPKPSAKSDSDVRLVSDASSSEVFSKPGSAVRLTDEPRSSDSTSDSDVRLLSDKAPAASGPAAKGPAGKAPSDRGDDSGSTDLLPLNDSGISLESANDSGISLSSDSTMFIGGDSGISLSSDDEEGISLSDIPVVAPQGSEKTKGPAAKSGAKAPVKKRDDDLTTSIPAMKDDPLADTEDALPLRAADNDDSDSSETSVITLDDDSEEYSVDGDSSSEFVAAEEDEEAEVLEDVVGEDDEIVEDVFGADDEDFDDGLTAGESSGEIATPRAAVAVEQDWGVGTLVGLGLSTVAMLLCGVLMLDMVRNLWHTDVNSRNPFASLLLDLFK